LFTDTLFCKGTPVDTGRTDESRVHLSAKFALYLCLIAPYFNVFAAVTTGDVFRFWLLYFPAAGTAIFKHFPSFLL
jgi:hypothetical protein